MSPLEKKTDNATAYITSGNCIVSHKNHICPSLDCAWAALSVVCQDGMSPGFKLGFALGFYHKYFIESQRNLKIIHIINEERHT
jgi:hypothetical protein